MLLLAVINTCNKMNDCKIVINFTSKNFWLFTDQYMTLIGENNKIREDLRVLDRDISKEIMGKFDAGDNVMVSVISNLDEESLDLGDK